MWDSVMPKYSIHPSPNCIVNPAPLFFSRTTASTTGSCGAGSAPASHSAPAGGCGKCLEMLGLQERLCSAPQHAATHARQPGGSISFGADRPVLKCHPAKGPGHKREYVRGNAEIWLSLVTVASSQPLDSFPLCAGNVGSCKE